LEAEKVKEMNSSAASKKKKKDIPTNSVFSGLLTSRTLK
jgi:hypothetical protein